MAMRTVWRLLYCNEENPCKIDGHFILSPVTKGDAQMMATALRKVLLGDLEGVCFTKAIFHNIDVPHKYSPIFGIEECLFEILENLKQIVLRSNSQNKGKASIRVSGPGRVTANDICLPSSVTIVDRTKCIANLTEAVDFSMDLEIERGRGSRCIEEENNPKDGAYSIDAVFMPVENVHFSIHDYMLNDEEEEMLFFEISTNGSITPIEALYEASNKLMKLFHISVDIGTGVEKKETMSRFILPNEKAELQYDENLREIKNEILQIIIESIQSNNENFMDLGWSSYPIDRLNICRSTYISLINFNIETIADLLRRLVIDGLVQVPGIGKVEYLEIVLSILNMLKNIVG
jgi:DNA-directed RNA polymerase subunit alpha